MTYFHIHNIALAVFIPLAGFSILGLNGLKNQLSKFFRLFSGHSKSCSEDTGFVFAAWVRFA